jgi:short-subunit dehydrogenase
MRIDGRTVLVTGASSGIGASCARRFAERGATRIVLVARTKEKLDALAGEIGDRARTLPLDCGSRDAVAQAAAGIEEEIGVPDILVNCAGAGQAYFFEQTPPEDFERMMAAPFFAGAYVTRAFLPGMLARGSGVVCNVGSPIAYTTWPGAAGYATARWAFRGLTEALRSELRGTGVQVVSVVPTTVESGYFEHNPGFERSIPGIAKLTGTLQPDEVGKAIVRAVERGKREIFVPFRLRAMITLSRFFPRTTEYFVARTGLQREAGGT